MLFSCAKKLLFPLFFITISPVVSALVIDAPPTPQQHANQLRQDMLESILKEVVKQLNELHIILEDYGLDLASGTISTVNKLEEMNRIKKLKQLTASLKENGFAQVDESALLFLLKLNQMLIEHMHQGILHTFSAINELRLDSIRSTMVHDEYTFEDLYNEAAVTNQKIRSLQEIAKNAGLRLYNRLYRAFDERIMQPSLRYKIPHIIGLLGLTGVAAFELWFHSENEHPLLRKLFGYAPHRLPSGDLNNAWHKGYTTIQDENDPTAFRTTKAIERPLKWIGHTEQLYHKYASGALPLVVLSAPLLSHYYGQAFKTSKEFIAKKLGALNNFLKGGEYHKRITSTIQTKTFDDLIGLEHAKEIGRSVLKYLEDPERFSRKNLVPERGYILYGKSRTGKSEFAKAFCGEIQKLMVSQGRDADDFKFFELKTSWILKDGMNFIYDLAQRDAPCVLFIDEIDLLGLQRAGGNRELLSEFLSSMSGFVDSDPKKQVIILAATNKPENLDFALRQRGRFGKAIYFDLPDYHHRAEYITKRLEELSVNIELFDIEKLALETEGGTYEDLNAIIKGAFQRAKIDGSTLDQTQLERSLDEEFRNIIFNHGKELSAQEQRLVAAYQLGKAAAHMVLKTPERISKITILPVISKLKEEGAWEMYNKQEGTEQEPIVHGTLFTYTHGDSQHVITREKQLNDIRIALAGTCLQDILLGTTSTSYMKRDKQNALKLAQSMISQGLEVSQFSEDTKNKMLDEAYTLLLEAQEHIKKALEAHAHTLRKALDHLVEHKCLTGQELAAFINGTFHDTERLTHETPNILGSVAA